MSRRIAAVDVGTNTALLVVAEFEQGRLRSCVELERIVRLGEGVDRHRRVSRDAMGRLVRVLGEYREVALRWGAETGVVGATSASRDAQNRDELIAAAERACGWPYEILDGETEARLTFAGAMRAVGLGASEAVMVDVGGGSTEIVRGTTGPPALIEAAGSADVGSVRIAERIFRRIPPGAEHIATALSVCRAALEPLAGRTAPAATVVGAGGTATVLAALAGAMAAPLPVDEVRRWRDRLLELTADEVLALDPDRLAGRQDVFPAGVLVLHAALELLRADSLVVSPWGLRHGLVLRQVGAL